LICRRIRFRGRDRPLTPFLTTIAAKENEQHRFLAEKSAISENTATVFQHLRVIPTLLERRALCTYETSVTLRIESLAGEHGTTLRLIGRIRAEHLDELRRQIAASAPSALELKEVTLVDADAVRFLGTCESEGIQLLNCSAYIREWIVRERESA
jgi:hypothetical protein